MQLTIEPGKYIVAVSGGVDSVVLLDVLSTMPDVSLVVAHFDHGIRLDSASDRKFVQELALGHDLAFVYEEATLGSAASEAKARKARYDFLQKTKDMHRARAIITAHHQDDVLETAIINLSRGTGRRGLTSLASSDELVRPLLDVTKVDLIAYALANDLMWQEDVTNSDQQYLRNHIRHAVIPKFDTANRQQFLRHINKLREINKTLELSLSTTLEQLQEDGKLDRRAIANMPEPIIKELLMFWWRQNGFYNYESKTLNRATDNVLRGRTGAIVPLKGDYSMTIERTKLALNKHER